MACVRHGIGRLGGCARCTRAVHGAPRLTPGSGTSSTERRRARTRRSTSGRSPRDGGAVAARRQGGQGQATLNTTTGAIDVGASPFGAYWYPVKAFGDAVFRIQYTVQDTPTSTRNGGVMIRTPEIRYTGANTTEVLAQKPTGFNYDVCPGAIPLCGLTTPAPSTTYKWPGSTREPPARLRVHRWLLRPADRGRRLQRQRPQQQPADGQRQRQQPSALDAGRLRPRGPDQRVPDRWRPAAVDGPDQDGLDLQLPQPQRQAVGHRQAPRQGRLARDGDPHDRPAVHRPDRRRGHQPVRQLDPEDRLPRR